MKSSRGITLTSLAIYIAISITVLATLIIVTTYFKSNLTDLNTEASYEKEFDKFNLYFLKDVKEQGNKILTVSNDIVEFSNDHKYEYIAEQKEIYYIEGLTTVTKKIKIAENVTSCNFSKEMINEKDKIIVTLTINNTLTRTNEYIMEYENTFKNYEIGQKYMSESIDENIDGYTKLGYIQSTGTQYINTDFKPNQSTRVIIKYCFTGNSTPWIMGARTTFSSNAYAICGYFNGGAYYFINYNNNYNSGPNFDLNIHTLEFNKNEIYYDGSKVLEFTYANFSTAYNMYILCLNENGTATSSCSAKLYSCKIYDNDILIRNFVPMLRNDDNKPGLYDKVNKEFYTNAGTDEFLYE